MSPKDRVDLDELFKNPEVQKAISNASAVRLARSAYQPPLCDTLDSPYSIVESANGYRFEINPEARRQLPNIINNKVQVIKGRASLDDETRTRYEQARKIGIVFSGGPAPGGHNVIAGLYDAAKKTNPRNQLFGFLVGPDGIIEGEYIELTDQLVDSYRNLGGFSMIKTGRTKIDTQQKMAMARETILEMGLDDLDAVVEKLLGQKSGIGIGVIAADDHQRIESHLKNGLSSHRRII